MRFTLRERGGEGEREGEREGGREEEREGSGEEGQMERGREAKMEKGRVGVRDGRNTIPYQCHCQQSTPEPQEIRRL